MQIRNLFSARPLVALALLLHGCGVGATDGSSKPTKTGGTNTNPSSVATTPMTPEKAAQLAKVRGLGLPSYAQYVVYSNAPDQGADNPLFHGALLDVTSHTKMGETKTAALAGNNGGAWATYGNWAGWFFLPMDVSTGGDEYQAFFYIDKNKSGACDDGEGFSSQATHLNHDPSVAQYPQSVGLDLTNGTANNPNVQPAACDVVMQWVGETSPPNDGRTRIELELNPQIWAGLNQIVTAKLWHITGSEGRKDATPQETVSVRVQGGLIYGSLMFNTAVPYGPSVVTFNPPGCSATDDSCAQQVNVLSYPMQAPWDDLEGIWTESDSKNQPVGSATITDDIGYPASEFRLNNQ